MRVALRPYNREGFAARRRWAVVGVAGYVIRRFESRWAAEDWLDRTAPGWRLAA